MGAFLEKNRSRYNIVRSCEILEVIKVEYLVGDGQEDPMRLVEDYYNKDGTLIFTFDPLEGK